MLFYTEQVAYIKSICITCLVLAYLTNLWLRAEKKDKRMLKTKCLECKTEHLIDEVCFFEDGRFTVIDLNTEKEKPINRRWLVEGRQILVSCPDCNGWIRKEEDEL